MNAIEVDLVATKMAVMNDNSTIFKISLVIQCKWSRNAAWVGFLNSIPKATSKDGIIKSVYNNDDRSFVTGLSRALEKQLEILNNDPDKSSYAMTTVAGIRQDEGGGNKSQDATKDIAYEAYRSIISGSLGVLGLGREDAITGHGRRCVHIVIPVVVFDGTLCEVSLNADGVIKCSPSSQMTLIYNGEKYFNISVMTKEAFGSWVPLVARDLSRIIDYVSSHGAKHLNHKTFAFVNRI